MSLLAIKTRHIQSGAQQLTDKPVRSFTGAQSTPAYTLADSSHASLLDAVPVYAQVASNHSLMILHLAVRSVWQISINADEHLHICSSGDRPMCRKLIPEDNKTIKRKHGRRPGRNQRVLPLYLLL